MQKDSQLHSTYLNFETSWLQFNQRVLSQAKDPSKPLLERVRFVSIVLSNLDEFFMKRVGGLKRQLHAGVKDLSVDGRTPEEQLSMIRRVVQTMIRQTRDCFFKELVPLLHEQGISIRTWENLTESQKKEAQAYFQTQLYPIITPLAVDEAHPFPFISNKSRSFAIQLIDPTNGEPHFARIKVPANRPRWIEVERTSDNLVLVGIDEIIRENIPRFFPGMEFVSAHMFRVTRNANVERNEEEADDLLEMIEEELRERRFAEVVRLELDHDTPKGLKTFLMEHLGVKSEDVFNIKGPLGLADTGELVRHPTRTNTRFEAWTPTLHPAMRRPIDEPAPSIFESIQKGFLVHHPYHSFETSTQRFVEEAARDPKVLAIKQTLYRTSSDSAVMHALIRAAEAGKQVAVLVEIKARFDEEQNILWAQKLEEAGVHVSYGIAGLKIHSKLTMVVREEEAGLKRYLHIGTGNYHPQTAQSYEDFGFFTCDEQIASDVTDLFNMLTGYAPTQDYDRLLVAPKSMRIGLLNLIDGEIKRARKGQRASIKAKMNNLEDPELIQKLYTASQAGVKIDLVVRSVCRLIPGVKGLSENIRVISVVGRFLEHSRCYCFHNAGETLYYIGSADWMKRNLDQRVEALCPIDDPNLKVYLGWVLDLYLSDTEQSWGLKANGEYVKRKRRKGAQPITVQEELMRAAKELRDPLPLSTRWPAISG